jgi:Photosynthesis system II assembly factor YCF48
MKRDESIERLLRSARPGEPARGTPGPCLDAETLAAWVDGGLNSNQVRQAELHVSSCARCQAMVAATMTSAPMTAAGAEEQPARRPVLGWLMPLAAGVAAAGLWFMVPSRTPLSEAPAPAVAMAPAPAATPPPPVDRQLGQAPVERPSEFRDQRAAESAAGKLDAARDRLAAPQARAGNEQKLETATAQRADEKSASLREEATAKLQQEAAAPKDAFAPQPAAPPVSEPARTTASGVTAPAAAAPRAALSAVAADRSANFQIAAIEVVSPNPSIRWRLWPGGMIQYSSDSGATWTQQSVGVSVDLLAGSAPSTEVCWVVGRAGTVLVTIDGGRQWRRATVVAGLDLQRVTATNASTAEVTAVDGRVFRTVDAGNTWR